ESVYQPKHRTAVELAQMVYRSFKSRSQLLDEGPNRLPAFRVYRQVRKTDENNLFSARGTNEAWFTMEIDSDKNRLVLNAPRYTTRGLTSLISRLDAPPPADGAGTRIVEGTPETMHVARQLQPELGRLRQPRAA